MEVLLLLIAITLPLFLLFILKNYNASKSNRRAPGTNNFLGTLARADRLPYGRDFDTHRPTGRFSNGKIPVDFLALRLGLPYIPTYLGQTASVEDMIHGVNYASAGAGLIFTSGSELGQHISFTQQVQQVTDTFRQLILNMALQQLLFRVLGCQPQGAAVHNFVIQLALSMIELISRLHHFHVVPLLGFCSENQGKRIERLLGPVYPTPGRNLPIPPGLAMDIPATGSSFNILDAWFPLTIEDVAGQSVDCIDCVLSTCICNDIHHKSCHFCRSLAVVKYIDFRCTSSNKVLEVLLLKSWGVLQHFPKFSKTRTVLV
ncbi:hypothetical protein POM88_037689 [Heracleum sosnowskyi]|uniref:Uncharacterized protein n=1 Tax=Heracleum sosnowskyi TaxID=360622 RepID=A0AAD8MG31_9APIA|nr:hypothetical protein POM88_037689 [Heracleum sosnowskyi]